MPQRPILHQGEQPDLEQTLKKWLISPDESTLDSHWLQNPRLPVPSPLDHGSEGLAHSPSWAKQALLWFATSGSTGQPGWVAHRRESLCASAHAVNDHVKLRKDDRWLRCLPLFHVGGFGVMARSVVAGLSTISYEEKWKVDTFVHCLHANRITLTTLVPAQVHDLVKARASPNEGLKGVIVGGGKLPFSIARAAESLGWPLLASYGMTEAASQIATSPLGEPWPESGWIPVLPHWDARVGTHGCLEIKGTSLAVGECRYHDGKWSWTSYGSHENEDQVWWKSCDVVELKENRLRFQHREGSQIKVLGELISLDDWQKKLEDSLESRGFEELLGKVMWVALEDERAENRVALVVEGRENVDKAKSWQAHWKDELPGIIKIRELLVLDAFPRSELGKIKVKELKERLKNGDLKVRVD